MSGPKIGKNSTLLSNTNTLHNNTEKSVVKQNKNPITDSFSKSQVLGTQPKWNILDNVNVKDLANIFKNNPTKGKELLSNIEQVFQQALAKYTQQLNAFKQGLMKGLKSQEGILFHSEKFNEFKKERQKLAANKLRLTTLLKKMDTLSKLGSFQITPNLTEYLKNIFEEYKRLNSKSGKKRKLIEGSTYFYDESLPENLSDLMSTEIPPNLDQEEFSGNVDEILPKAAISALLAESFAKPFTEITEQKLEPNNAKKGIFEEFTLSQFKIPKEMKQWKKLNQFVDEVFEDSSPQATWEDEE